MAEKRPIQDLMGVTMEKMREMVDTPKNRKALLLKPLDG